MLFPADVSLRRLLAWLVEETTNYQFIDDILGLLCDRLVEAGVPVSRAALYFYTQNPEWLGARVLWEEVSGKVGVTTFDYGVETTPGYLNSPVRELVEGASIVRQKMSGSDVAELSPFFQELMEEGASDYVAWPLVHSMGKRNAISFATSAVGGFSEDHIAVLSGLIPTFALVSEIRVKNHIMRTLLNTYVGPHAAKQIISGATTRGSGVTVRAAVLVFDIRNFTAMSNSLPGDAVIELLNKFFDTMSEPLVGRGGEILKFMGDGFLAMIPTTEDDACARVLDAIADAEAAMASWNSENSGNGVPIIDYGIAVHVGDVIYGNIGTRNRLDFTVIGPAVNAAARLEEMTKSLGRRVLISQSFVDESKLAGRFVPLGKHKLKGISEPLDLYGLGLSS
ncbi:adenylate/guanylate cyclase domain-containing protein [Rhizobium sp. S152]|uniref:adenylate/guanylate cyclase domain-containing protein n=1 Tax=Rhizobium sp. S152 TaxID=3055038 RepID=UPI0025A96DE8|nr:adenylate/guanylate cyclase domain-containing protein [Rhizobium sp. S152]